MEDKVYLTIPLNTKDEEKKEPSDPLAPTYRTWSTRWKCCQTYLCLSMSFLAVMSFCVSLIKYGFAILIPYLTFTVILAAPGVLAEVLFGRYGGGNVLRTWSMCPPGRGLFFCFFFMTCCIIIQRNIFNIFISKYLFYSLYGRMQWGDCNNKWARENCFELGQKKSAYLECVAKYSEKYCSNLKWESSAKQFWKYFVTSKSRGLDLLWNFIWLMLTSLVILAVIFRGIHSLEKTLVLLVYPIFTFSIILGIVSLSVPNALRGFLKLFSFEWGNIINLRLWTAGFFDIFLNNCLGTLSLSFISGHGKFTDNILLDVFTVTFIAFISRLIFTVPVLCVISSIKDIQQEFNGLVEVLVVISEAFLLYPIPSGIWSALYFLNALFMSLSSQAIMFLAIAEALQSIFKRKSINFWVLVVTGVAFVLSYTIESLWIREYADTAIALAVNFLLTSLTWQLFYGIENFKTDFHFMMGFPVPYLVKCTWIILIIVPLTIMIVMFFIKQIKPSLSMEDYLVSACLIGIYIFNILFYMFKYKKDKVKVVKSFMANPDWGPHHPLLKKSRKLFGVSTVTREFTYRQELNKKPLVKPPEFSDQNIVNLIYVN